MIVVDTQILVYSVRGDAPHHQEALDCVRRLAEGNRPWGMTWTNVHEFLGIVTHPRIYIPPTSLADALRQVRGWMASPAFRALAEPPGYLEHLEVLATEGRVKGPRVHDARIAALCRAHGVRELWSADRDFSRFPGLLVRNPLEPPVGNLRS